MGKKLRHKEGEGINFGDLKLENPELSDLSPNEQARLWRELGEQVRKKRGEDIDDKKE